MAKGARTEKRRWQWQQDRGRGNARGNTYVNSAMRAVETNQKGGSSGMGVGPRGQEGSRGSQEKEGEYKRRSISLRADGKGGAEKNTHGPSTGNDSHKGSSRM